jgi:hypothetical protein
MKKQPKEFKDTRFDIGYDTEILNEIKKNNKTLELLDQMIDIIEHLTGNSLMYYASQVKPMADNLVYKDKEGDEINQYEFWDNIYYFINRNQDWLLRDSKDKYEKLNNPKKRKVA